MPDIVGVGQHKPTSVWVMADRTEAGDGYRLARKRVQPRNRMRENHTAVSVQGVQGNQHHYCGGSF